LESQRTIGCRLGRKFVWNGSNGGTDFDGVFLELSQSGDNWTETHTPILHRQRRSQSHGGQMLDPQGVHGTTKYGGRARVIMAWVAV